MDYNRNEHNVARVSNKPYHIKAKSKKISCSPLLLLLSSSYPQKQALDCRPDHATYHCQWPIETPAYSVHKIRLIMKTSASVIINTKF